MEFILSKEILYRPKWNGNRDLPKDKQVVVVYKFRSGIEQQTMWHDVGLTPEDLTSQSKKYWLYDFLSFCDEIRNLKIKDGEKVIDATPKDVATRAGLAELYTEIRLEYARMTRVDAKN